MVLVFGLAAIPTHRYKQARGLGSTFAVAITVLFDA